MRHLEDEERELLGAALHVAEAWRVAPAARRPELAQLLGQVLGELDADGYELVRLMAVFNLNSPSWVGRLLKEAGVGRRLAGRPRRNERRRRSQDAR